MGEASRERSVSLKRVLRIAVVSGQYYNPRELLASHMMGGMQLTFFAQWSLTRAPAEALAYGIADGVD